MLAGVLALRATHAVTTTGEIIGPYLLGKCLGKGGFGAVYSGTHQETGQCVAIKFLHDTREMEPEVQSRFVREVALLKRFDHENIVQMFESDVHEGRIYCAMELVECGSLKEVLVARRQLPWREAVEVAVQVCYALAHAHPLGCVHRDLKPANLYLAEDGLVKLGDMGLARDLTDSRLTAEGQTVGTWRYMPPEQIMGMEDIDGRLDLYALGCILFEMIAGEVPFDGADFATIFDQHLESAPARLDVLVADCPPALADVVDHLLEKDPNDRPENATVLAEQLESILTGKLVHAEPSSVATNQDSASSIPQKGPNLTQRLHGSPTVFEKSGKWQILGIISALLVLLVAIVLAVKNGD